MILINSLKTKTHILWNLTSIKSIEIQNVPAPVNPDTKNPNDTDLDQTFNLNASYEIIPARQSFTGSPIIDSYDLVENLDVNIVDCTKLNTDDDIIQFINNKTIEDEQINENVTNYESDFANDDEDNNDDEELTVLVPELLNKIEEPHEQIPELSFEETKNEIQPEIADNKESIQEAGNKVMYTTITDDPPKAQVTIINFS